MFTVGQVVSKKSDANIGYGVVVDIPKYFIHKKWAHDPMIRWVAWHTKISRHPSMEKVSELESVEL